MACRIFTFHLLLLLITGLELTAQDTLIRQGDVWHYQDDGSYPGNGWTEQHFPVESWKSGPSPLGYSYDSLATVINFGDSTKKVRPITSFFKKNFTVKDTSSYLAYKAIFRRDDGAVVYLNNEEVIRSNMPEGNIDHLTHSEESIKGAAESAFHTKYLEPKKFRKGINTVAISVHQRAGVSSDHILDFELVGITDPKMLHQFLEAEKQEELDDKISLLDKKLELNEEKMKNSFNTRLLRIQRGILGVGALLLALLAYAFFAYSLRKRKERDSYLEAKADLEQKFQVKNQEFINYAISTMRIKNFFNELRLELMQFNTTSGNAKNDLPKLIRKVEAQANSEEDWEKMKLHFDAVYSGFFDRLSKEYPSLSQQELRHCSFMRLRLETKEISQILRIDPKSVQIARYRIKKKMNLSESQELKEFIFSF